MLDSRWQEDFGSLAAPSIAPDPPAFSSDFAEYLHVSRSTSGSSIKSGNEEQSFCDHKMYDVVENREPSIREPMRRAFWNDRMIGSGPIIQGQSLGPRVISARG